MLKHLTLFSAVLLTTCQVSKQTPTQEVAAKATTSDAHATYTTYCASCHGEKVEAFVDRRWKYGNSVDALVKSISTGYPDNGMPSWKGSLSDEQITAVATLINEKLSTVSAYTFSDKPKSNVFESKNARVKLDTIATGIDVPWGMAFLPSGNYLISDRNGKLYEVNNSKQKQLIKGLPEILSEGQGGLLDIALHPNYAQNGWVYLSYSKPKREDGKTLATTAVVRGKIQNGQWTSGEEVFEALPYYPTRHHYGSRLVFDKKGYLFITVGDRGRHNESAQSLNNSCGKVHRIFDDGRIPTDNPFVTTPNAIKSIYSYGHRNQQGMAMHPETGDMWAHEHGPRGGDEVNRIKAGANYGWPVISYGINYDGTTFTNLTAKEGMEQPNLYWIPSIAPSGLAFASDKYPAWKGDLMAGSLRFNYLNRCVMKNGKIVEQEKLLPNIGRMRLVTTSPDGYLYIGVETPGYVFRLLPVDN